MVETKTLVQYKCILASFMSFVHGRPLGGEYDRDHVHSMEVLAAVTPNDVVNYMNLRTYGTTNPDGDANPTSARAHTIAMDKKAISFFMPNREKWSMTRNEGNPTQSAGVNGLIKRIKKKEARKQGKESQTRRPMQGQEFVAMHRILNMAATAGSHGEDSHTYCWKRFGVAAIAKYQFHMIARVDDSTQVTLQHIRVHDNFPHCLKTRLNWSKNVNDERDAPWQIMLGSINPVYCVLCSLALWLELNLMMFPPAMDSPYVFCFSDNITIPKGGENAKTKVQNLFTKIFRSQDFRVDDGEAKSLLLGSHSIRKYAATYSRRCGCTKDEKEIRGRWKGVGRVSDVYDDVELPYPDAKVAEKLCGGGACFYINDPTLDATMMNSFVLSHVVPNVRKRLPDSACLVLGRALLWLICSPVADEYVPMSLKTNVLSEWIHIRGPADPDNEAMANPIKQMAVTVTGDHGAVYIDMVGMLGGEGEAVGGVGPAGGMNVSIRNQLLGVQSCLLSLRQENLEIKTAIEGMKAAHERAFGIVNGNIRRIAMRPGGPRNATATVTGGVPLVAPPAYFGAGDDLAVMATLMPTPRSLHELWLEFQHGVGGRKAARLFSHSERGRSKHRYHRRKVVWDLVGGLIRQGHTAEVAIDRIYAVYGGQTSVTNIINGLKADKKIGLSIQI